MTTELTRREIRQSGQAITSFDVEPVHWLWPGWIPRGAVSMLASRPGIGKSTITMYLAMCAAGEGAPDRQWPSNAPATEPAPVVMLAFEDAPSHTLRPTYNALTLPGHEPAESLINVQSDLMSVDDARRWLREPDAMRQEALALFQPIGATLEDVHDIASPTLAEIATDAAYGRTGKERKGARAKLLRIGVTLEVEHQFLKLYHGTPPGLWIIDPLANLTSTLGLNENNNAEMNSLFRMLSDLADRHDVALLVVHHNRKPSAAGEAVFEQRGASAITAAVRSQIALDMGDGEERIMGLVKANWAPERGVVTWEMRDYADRVSEGAGALFDQPMDTRDLRTVALVPIKHNPALTFDLARKEAQDAIKERAARKVEGDVQQAIIDTLRNADEPLSINRLAERIKGMTIYRLRTPIAGLVKSGDVVAVPIGKSHVRYALPRLIADDS